MADAVVFSSKTGFTGEYARMLGRLAGLTVYPLKNAWNAVPKGTRIIYLAPVRDGEIMHLKQVRERYLLDAVCAVGLLATSDAAQEMIEQNRLTMPFLLMQGGYRTDGLSFRERVHMRSLRRRLQKKEKRSPEEADVLTLLADGGSRVNESNLQPLVDWLRSRARQPEA